MKQTIAAFIGILMTATLMASMVKLGWDDPTNPAGTVTEYRLYNTKGEGNETNRVKVATVPYSGVRTNIQQEVDLPVGMNKVTVTAVSNTGIESADSEPLTVVIPARPANLRVIIEITPGE
jgi:hypothetical protein